MPSCPKRGSFSFRGISAMCHSSSVIVRQRTVQSESLVSSFYGDRAFQNTVFSLFTLAKKKKKNEASAPSESQLPGRLVNPHRRTPSHCSGKKRKEKGMQTALSLSKSRDRSDRLSRDADKARTHIAGHATQSWWRRARGEG